MPKDVIGQDVKIGDWAVITQHNEVFVGKVVNAGSTITIAINRAQEWLLKNQKEFDKIKSWEKKHEEWEKMFGINAFKNFGGWGYRQNPSWVRDGKFVKIEPTKKLLDYYENGKS